jgi:hypothetical protein
MIPRSQREANVRRRQRRRPDLGMWIAIGGSIGVALGISMDNLAIGLVIGLGIGLMFGSGLMSRPRIDK